MSYCAVIGEAGPGWSEGGTATQPGVAEHAAFMNGLADEGFVLFAGPLAGSENGRRLRATRSEARESAHSLETRKQAIHFHREPLQTSP